MGMMHLFQTKAELKDLEEETGKVPNTFKGKQEQKTDE